MIAAISGQFTLGNLLTLVVLLGLGLAGYFHIKGLKRQALERSGEFWERQALSFKAIIDEQRGQIDALKDDRDEQRRLKHEALGALEAERKMRDLRPIVEALGEQSEAFRTFAETVVAEVGVSARSQQATSEILEGLVGNVAELNTLIRKVVNGDAT